MEMRSVRINSICLSFTSPPSLLVLKNDCRYFPNSQTQIKTIHDMVTYSSPRFASVREVFFKFSLAHSFRIAS